MTETVPTCSSLSSLYVKRNKINTLKATFCPTYTFLDLYCHIYCCLCESTVFTGLQKAVSYIEMKDFKSSRAFLRNFYEQVSFKQGICFLNTSKLRQRLCLNNINYDHVIPYNKCHPRSIYICYAPSKNLHYLNHDKASNMSLNITS